MISIILWFADLCLRVRRLGRIIFRACQDSAHRFAVWLADFSAPSVELSREAFPDDLDFIVYLDVLFVLLLSFLFAGAFLCGRWSAHSPASAPARQLGRPTTLAAEVPHSPPPRPPAIRTLSPAPRLDKKLASLGTRPARVLRRVVADPPSPSPGQCLIVPLCRVAPSAGGGLGLP